ncbi:hypothetical protein MMC10_005920 [Thelotrema lepadinum]|nr:hypothetical protein [Thelotrema lepadinum]
MPATDEESDSERAFRARKKRKVHYSVDDLHTLPTRPPIKASQKTFSREDYTVGWICALAIEMTAARAMLDDVHPDLDSQKNDNNAYIFGRTGKHNVVIAGLPSGVYGTTSATSVTYQMDSSFPSLRIRLMVGIGGGVPGGDTDIRLGDVVVSTSNSKSAAVVQYDFGKLVKDGRLERMGSLNKPPQLLLSAVTKLRVSYDLSGSHILDILSEVKSRWLAVVDKYTHRGHAEDLLFSAGYEHQGSEESCHACGRLKLEGRIPRDAEPRVHYGPIASANQVMKHAGTRDRLAKELGIICFEMEAAGLMDNFPCLVIRGVSDYSDSHNHYPWQNYAAATAAAYSKELLAAIPPMAIAVATQEDEHDPAESIVEHRKSVMESLKFDQADIRRATIKLAHAKTCEWLLQLSEYQDWTDWDKIIEHQGLLWIKGKSGTGKSTIMKFALERAARSRDMTTISFFFNARGDDLERTTTGMYRSLLFQLLEKVPKLQEILDSMGLMPTSGGSSSGWGIELLKDTIRSVLKDFNHERLLCFVDALDECAEDEVRDMVEFFEDLGQLTVTDQIRLFVCFFSRHYSHISIDKGVELVLDKQEGHSQDIVRYLSSKLKAGRSKPIEQIRAEILQKASGIFLWVVFVVQILNKEYDRGRIHALRKRLAEISIELNELFLDILRRDNQNMTELLLCIQWILFNKSTLSRQELYFGILSGADEQSLGPWDPEETTLEDMERFILSSSKGLAEINRGKKPQFIHESVREFFLKNDGFASLWPEIKDFQSHSHEKLRTCCQEYLKYFSLQPPVYSFSESNPASDVVRDSICTQYPLLKYAVYYELLHADAAEEGGVSQDAFVREFEVSELQLWIPLANMFETRKIRRYTSEASLLYILADRNLPNLIKVHLRRCTTIDVKGERYEFPALAAIFNRHHKAAKAFLMPATFLQHNGDIPKGYFTLPDPALDSLIECGRSVKARSGQSFLSYTASCGNELVVQRLLHNNRVDVPSKDWKGRTALSYAAMGGHVTIIELLIATGHFGYDSEDYNERTPLSYAAEGGHTNLVRHLLSTGQVNPDSRASNGQTPLFLAAAEGHEDIVQSLLSCDQVNPNSKAKLTKETPLHRAAERGYHRVVQMLLSNKQLDLNPIDSQGTTPLLLAAERGHEEVFRVLLVDGRINSNVVLTRGTLLHIAAEKGHEGVVRLLLSLGQMDPNPTDKDRRTPLSYAASNGHEDLVWLLLSNEQVYPDSKDKDGRTPLYWAVKDDQQGVIGRLLSNDRVDPNHHNPCGFFETPLLRAAADGNEGMVKQLLSSSRVEPDSCDKGGRTPLSWAAWLGDGGVVQQLLSTGRVDPDSRDREGQTPLFWAAKAYTNSMSEANYVRVIEQLLSTGRVDPDNVTLDGSTPLQVVVIRGHKQAVDLLLASSPVNLSRRRYACSRALAVATDQNEKKIVEQLLAYRKGFQFDLDEKRPDLES